VQGLVDYWINGKIVLNLAAHPFAFGHGTPMFRIMKQRHRRTLTLVFTAFFAVFGAHGMTAQDTVATDEVIVDDTAAALSVVDRWQTDPTEIFDASEINLNDLAFIARPVVVFADSPNDPRFAEQIRLLLAQAQDLAPRHVIIIADSDPGSASQLRLMLRPHGFALVLLDTDGRVALRKPEPWDVRELTRVIDKMPSRLREIGR
jgi:hypothetical protein